VAEAFAQASGSDHLFLPMIIYLLVHSNLSPYQARALCTAVLVQQPVLLQV
jgi:hypothetical protein